MLHSLEYICICIRNELLNLVPLAGNAHGQDVYDALVNLFQELNIDIKLMKSIAMDGCPSMVICLLFSDKFQCWIGGFVEER